jgi:hypothetical protein
MTADTITAIKKALMELPLMKVEFSEGSSEGNSIISPTDDFEDAYFTVIGCGTKQDDLGRLIALSVNSMPGLLSTIEALQRENEELRQDRDRTARNRDMYKGQVERQAAQIEDFRSETKRLQVGVYVETFPAVHLISVFVDDMNERNWDDKRAYIKQQADRIRTALASTGGEPNAE